MNGLASVAVPADVTRQDRLLLGLTAAQVAAFAVAGLLAWGGWGIVHSVCPPAMYLAVCVPVLLAVAIVVLGRRDGVPLAVWLRAAVAFRRAPRRMAWPEPADSRSLPEPPRWLRATGRRGWRRPPGPWRSPARGINADGLIDLGPDGTTAVLAASTVTFGLAQPGVQYALLGGFARCLHGLDAPIQILLRAAPVDLRPHADHLATGAPHLATRQLTDAARAHAAWLAGLGAEYELLTREAFVAVRDRTPSGAARRAVQTAADLTAAGVPATAVMADEALGLLADSLNPAIVTEQPAPPVAPAPPAPPPPAAGPSTRGGWPLAAPAPRRTPPPDEGDRW
ncbi:PrgI family protein [Cryptosporangium sp. NPDC048952]|uniref:PrgI family protein n=1 Tax=Cryptosporangium sp. NPDC048952 TaxID=3363961 RepID=UPI003711F3EB